MSQPANDEFSQHLSDDEASKHEDASGHGNSEWNSKKRISIGNNDNDFNEWMMQRNLEAIRTSLVSNAKFKENADGVFKQQIEAFTIIHFRGLEKGFGQIPSIYFLQLEAHVAKVSTGMQIIRWRVRVDGKTHFSKSHSPVSRPIVRNTARMTYSHAVKGNWGSAVKTSAGYNWRNSNSNCDSGPTFIRTDHPLKNMIDRGIFDSGCSGHMTGNKDQLEDFEEFNGGSVTFGGSKGYISGKGKIRVGNLDFDSVSFVKELGHFNLFSISQICDKQHKVLFTETECLVVSSDFKMPDENQILLKVPRHHNMYSFDMKTPTPAKGFACLIAKATSDESKLWHRRLGLLRYDSSSGFRWFQIYSVHQRKVLGCVLMHTWEGDPPTASSRLKPMKSASREGIDGSSKFSILHSSSRLEIPIWKWMNSMIFVTGLPTTQKDMSDWVVLTRLTKSAHFLPISERTMEYVFLKVSPFRGVKRFGINGKLSPRFIGPFETLERKERFSIRLALPSQLSHIHDVFHVASYPFDQIQPDMSLSEEPESILDRQERVMRNKVIPFVKILWKNHPEREATWETEESMRASYPHFFV
ncbi:ribonuclease H-like domain-containing protein [Tanacetum coccineum]